MVTQSQEEAPVDGAAPIEAAPVEPAPIEDQPEPQNPILSEIDRMNMAPDVDIDTLVEEPVAGVSEQPATETQPVSMEPAEPIAPQPPQPPQPTPEQLQQLQRQAVEYEEIRRKAAIHEETRKYQQQLEEKGYSESQAQEGAQQYIQSRESQQALMHKADEYGQHILGKVAASEHFAQKYALGMDDLTILRQAENPAVMEELAKKMSNDRKMHAELDQLRKAQVPPQQYDSSQGEPQVASSDGSWLVRYNAGDRSTNAVSAARRAAGLS